MTLIGLFGEFDSSLEQYLASRKLECRVYRDASVCRIENVIAELDGVVIRSPFKLSDQSAENAKRLQFVVRAGSGTDNISSLFSERGVEVRTTPNNAYSVAELALALILNLNRHVLAGHASLARGEWKKYSLVGRELRGKTVGILGFGRIGRELAKLLRHFGVRILAHDRSPTNSFKIEVASQCDVKFVGLDDLLTSADILVVCLPASPQTTNLMNDTRLGMLGRETIVVNVGRGSLINTESLVARLKTGRLGGAALDVFEVEPPGKLELFSLDNVVCTPHLGAQTEETHRVIAMKVIDHLDQILGA